MKNASSAQLKKLAIVTGTSGGIGAAVVKLFLEKNFRVLGLSRQNVNPLISEIESGAHYTHTNVDLSDRLAVEKAWKTISRFFGTVDLESIILVNNAATEQPIANLERTHPDDLAQTVNTNLLAPLMLSAFFIRDTEALDVDKRIINISSGLATRNLAGLPAYCVTKAGLEMLTRQITEEQKSAAYPVVSVSARPAVVATAMQARLRETPLSGFPAATAFRGFHDRGELEKPLAVAEALVRDLAEAEVLSGACYRFGDGVFNLIQ